MLGAHTTPRHTILATVLAIGVALPVVYATEVTADSKVAITDVERKITAIDKVVKRHTYELRDATARAPSDATRSLYRLTGKGGEVFYFEGPADPGGIDINQVAVELFMKKNRKFVSYDSAWAEVQGIWTNLSHTNQRIARAKALRHFESRPSGVLPEEWDDRVLRSESQWHIR